jgi:hypothetical protein
MGGSPVKVTRIIVAAALAACVPGLAAAGEASADSAAVRPITLPAPALDGLRTQNYYLRDLEGVSPGHLNLSLSMSSMQWYAPPTRFEAVMQGAGTAATLGLFLGAVGNTLSWFDEETTWWITGGLAAVGAAYAGATYQEPENGLRIKWSVGEDKH